MILGTLASRATAPIASDSSHAMDVNSNIAQETSDESSVKDPLPAIECTEEIAEDNHHDFNHAVEAIEETVKDDDSYHACYSISPASFKVWRGLLRRF